MLKYLSLFSGIGSPEQALKNLGVEFELLGFSEIDKYAIKSYCTVHGVDESLNLGDITKVDIESLPLDIDLITHGSPCQDFSVAGNGKGGDLGSGTRSSLMWNTVAICEHCQPKFVIWENVKNVLSKKHRHNFEKYLEEMDRIGYNNFYQVLNAKDYGVPQNRERIFVVSIRKDLNKDFEFPKGFDNGIRLKDILEDEVDEKYYLSLEKTRGFIEEYSGIGGGNSLYMVGLLNIKGTEQVRRVYDPEGICPCLNTMQGGNRQPKIMGHRIRKLTPKEAWRLMGFKDEQFLKAEQVCSNSQLYKQAGNSIVVNVMEEIFKNLMEIE